MSELMQTQVEIERLRGAVEEVYDAVEAKGCTVPEEKTVTGLVGAVGSIPSPSSSIVRPYIISYRGLSDIGDFGIVDLSQLVKFREMFYACTGISGIVDLRNKNVRNISYDCTYIFIAASNVTEIYFPQMTMSEVYGGFSQCNSLTKIDLSQVSAGSNIAVNNMFQQCPRLSSIIVGAGWQRGFDASQTALTHDGIVALFDSLPTISTSQTITLGSTKLGYLSAAEKAIATDKGWTLA